LCDVFIYASAVAEHLESCTETSRAFREGLIEDQAATSFLPVRQIRVHTTGGKTSEGIDVLV
jgi:hypothetical protein